MTYALGTSRGVITKAPLLLIDLDTEEGITGRSYLWCYFPAAMPAIASILGEVERTVKGEPVAPVELWAKLAERFALIGVQGIVRMAMAGLDVAAWDALALALNVPLATLIGSTPKRIPAYNSCGLGLMAPEKVADEAEKLLAGGFRAVKLRLGYPTLRRRPRRAARGAQARRRRHRHHGRLQPGARPRRGAGAWPCARRRRRLLARRADPPRRLCGLRDAARASSRRRSRSARISPSQPAWRRRSRPAPPTT